LKLLVTLATTRRRGRSGQACSLIILASLSCAPRLHGAQTLPAALQTEFQQGVDAVQAGRLEDAERAFLRVLHEGGRVSFVYNNLGAVYQMRGDQTGAILQFREAIRLQPDYAAPRILLGASLLATGQNVEAVRELERAVKLAPDEPLARTQLAEADQRIGNFAAAIEQYQALRSLQPHDPEYLYQFGRAYSRRAEWCLIEIRRISPDSACLYETLAENYGIQGRLDLAVSAYQRALQVEPKRPGIHLALAQICVQQGRKAEARKEISEELAVVPESVEAQALAKSLDSDPKN
jgi:Flp pilus assembly protein TadD